MNFDMKMGFGTRETAQLWRWEKFDFEKLQVHVSCPVCYRITKASIADVMAQISESHSDCTFSGAVAYDVEASRQYEDWQKRVDTSAKGPALPPQGEMIRTSAAGGLRITADDILASKVKATEAMKGTETKIDMAALKKAMRMLVPIPRPRFHNRFVYGSRAQRDFFEGRWDEGNRPKSSAVVSATPTAAEVINSASAAQRQVAEAARRDLMSASWVAEVLEDAGVVPITRELYERLVTKEVRVNKIKPEVDWYGFDWALEKPRDQFQILDLHAGMATLRCPSCGHIMLLSQETVLDALDGEKPIACERGATVCGGYPVAEAPEWDMVKLRRPR